MDLERFDAIFGQHTGLSAGSKHERNVRTVNISVKEPGLVAKFGQGQRQVHRQCGLTNASLARANGNNRVNSRKRLRPWRGLSGTRRHVRGQEITLGEEMSRLDYTGSGLCGGGRSPQDWRGKKTRLPVKNPPNSHKYRSGLTFPSLLSSRHWV